VDAVVELQRQLQATEHAQAIATLKENYELKLGLKDQEHAPEIMVKDDVHAQALARLKDEYEEKLQAKDMEYGKKLQDLEARSWQLPWKK
jgi:hypothetical protein